MTAISLQTRLGQAPVFSPRLQHAVRLLQMSTLDYTRALQEEALSNPFLDVQPPEQDFEAADAATPSVQSSGDAEIEWAQGLDRLSANSGGLSQRISHDDSFDMLQQTPVRMCLRSHLHAQLGVLRLQPEERFLAEAVIEALDDDGYLRISLEDIAVAVEARHPNLHDDLRVALCRVQAFEPLGVAARSVAECLLLQLRAVADAQVREMAERIVSSHLELLATRRLQRLSQALGASETATQRAIECILRLDPRPGSRFGDQEVRSIVPDVIVRKVRGSWRTALNTGALPRVRLDTSYAALFEQHRRDGDAPMRNCLDQARWTVQNASQRVSTILDIATVIVARQKLFLEYGPLAMKPLGLRDIADAVGVHPSTVSRAVHHKYLATPHGVFELHHFFSRGMAHSGGGTSAPVALQALIRELIESEAPASPWSDAALARELAQQGFRIARRTVTKYRQGLNIDAVERRRAA